MSGAPLKVRCYQCNQLLGVSRTKIGTVVVCPKCRADLIVPDPEEAGSSLGGEDFNASGLSRFDEPNEAGISLELLDIRPEDIRVEPGVSWTPAVEQPARQPYSYPPPEPEPTESEPPGLDPAAIVPGDLAGTTSEPPSPPPEAIAPPIQFQSPRVAESRLAPTRPRDVVLPRSVVATWSLFVLVAQGLAFVAGLLAGHFLWRIH